MKVHPHANFSRFSCFLFWWGHESDDTFNGNQRYALHTKMMSMTTMTIYEDVLCCIVIIVEKLAHTHSYTVWLLLYKVQE